MKKIMSFLLAALLLFSPATMAFASPIDGSLEDSGLATGDFSSFIECINSVIVDADCFGLSTDDFCNIYLGLPIQTYEISLNGTLEENNFKIYPVFSDDQMLFEILKTESGDTQVSKHFSSILSSFENKSVAIVYDSSRAYVVEDNLNNIQTICSFSDYSGGRGELNAFPDLFSNANISWSLVCRNLPIPTSAIGIQPIADAVLPPITLATPIVMQVDTRICWAACVASIGNYRTNSNFTAQYVAQQHFGTNYNQYGDLQLSMDMLFSIYGVSYQFRDFTHIMDDEKIHRNLSAGYPVIARWDTGGETKHQTVIRGINFSLGRLYLMDPEIGYIQASKQGGTYRYVGASGNTLTFMGYASKYYY